MTKKELLAAIESFPDETLVFTQDQDGDPLEINHARIDQVVRVAVRAEYRYFWPGFPSNKVNESDKINVIIL